MFGRKIIVCIIDCCCPLDTISYCVHRYLLTFLVTTEVYRQCHLQIIFPNLKHFSDHTIPPTPTWGVDWPSKYCSEPVTSRSSAAEIGERSSGAPVDRMYGDLEKPAEWVPRLQTSHSLFENVFSEFFSIATLLSS